MDRNAQVKEKVIELVEALIVVQGLFGLSAF